MALDSHNNVFGRTLNPLNTAVTPGGSSGGEGALLGLRGSILGVGTDVGGSIRIPAMCNGTFGIKPSCQRIPYAGQESGSRPGAAKTGLPASAGPLAHSARDLELFFRTVAGQEPWMQDPDVVPSPWSSLASLPTTRKLRVGIVRTDGIVTPHPPIARLLDEVATKLQTSGIGTIDMNISPLFAKCQPLSNALFNIEGGNAIFDLLDAGAEPLSPWLVGRLKRQAPKDLKTVQELHGRREALQKEFLGIWGKEHGAVDLFICPVAPHPVPPVDRYNGVNYTSAFVLLDYPAGVVPVRTFAEADMQGEMEGEAGGSWDKANRKLCKFSRGWEGCVRG